MSHVIRASYRESSKTTTPEELKKIIAQRKWQTVEIKITDADLLENIEFLNDAVVIRQSSEARRL